MSPSPRRKLLFTVLTFAAAMGLIECGSAALEWTVLRRTLPPPRPDLEPTAFPETQADPEKVTRWGGRLDAPVPTEEEGAPPGAHIILQEDPTKGWRLPANHTGESMGIRYHINRYSMRGPLPPRPQPGTARLLTIGDSSIYGDTVDEADVFSDVAAAQLAGPQAWGCPVVAINGGVPGYTSDQALTWLREIWAKTSPDVVVIGTMWSDVYPERARPRTEPRPLRRLATYRVTRMLLSPWLSAQKVRWINSQDDIVADDSEAAVPLPRYIDNLRQAAAFAQEKGATAAFLALPAPVDLDRAPVPEIIQEYRAAMAMVAEQTGSAFVDGPAWMAREGGDLTLFSDNVHPSAAGHALVGYATAQTLALQPAPCQP